MYFHPKLEGVSLKKLERQILKKNLRSGIRHIAPALQGLLKGVCGEGKAESVPVSET